MQRYLKVVAAAICCFALMFWGAQALAPKTISANESGFERTVAVTGEVNVKVDPDVARLSVAVETEAKTAERAAEDNAEAMDKVIAALKDAGVKEDDITTTGYNLHAQYHWDEGKQYLVGYTASNNIQFTTGELDRVGELLDLAIENGANRANTPVFTVADQEAKKLELLRMAMDNAKAKAKTLVESADAELGVVVTINENHIGGQWERMPMMEFAYDAKASNVNTPIMPGDVELSCSIQVIFEIK